MGETLAMRLGKVYTEGPRIFRGPSNWNKRGKRQREGMGPGAEIMKRLLMEGHRGLSKAQKWEWMCVCTYTRKYTHIYEKEC